MKPTFEKGESFTHQRTCDRYRPIYYGAASGDFNPIHIDPKVGEAAGLGGVILQGMCTMAWAAEAAVNYLGDPGALKKIRVRFSRPVLPEDTVTFQLQVTGAEGGKLSADLRAKNQRGEDVLKGASIEALLPEGR